MAQQSDTAQQTAPAAATGDNRRIMFFTLGMTTVVAVVLGLLFFGLKPVHEANEAVSAKRAILAAVSSYLPQPVTELGDDEVQEVFDSSVEQYVITPTGEIVEGEVAENVDLSIEYKKPEMERVYPLYVYNDGSEDFYILSVRGNGLWDEIWGNVALKGDLATIAGVSFDHKGETPGLGAEIKDNAKFKEQFQDKRIMDYNGTYTSVLVRKGGAQDPVYEVDGISGATVTANGVSEMLNRGIAFYLPYIQRIQQEEGIDLGSAIGMAY